MAANRSSLQAHARAMAAAFTSELPYSIAAYGLRHQIGGRRPLSFSGM